MGVKSQMRIGARALSLVLMVFLPVAADAEAPKANVTTWVTHASTIGPEVHVMLSELDAPPVTTRIAMTIPATQPSACHLSSALLVRRSLKIDRWAPRESGGRYVTGEVLSTPPKWVHRVFVTGFGSAGDGCVVHIDVQVLTNSGARAIPVDVSIPKDPPSYPVSPPAMSEIKMPTIESLVERDAVHNLLLVRIRTRNESVHPIRLAMLSRRLTCDGAEFGAPIDPLSPVPPGVDSGPFEVPPKTFAIFAMSIRSLNGESFERCAIKATIGVDPGDFTYRRTVETTVKLQPQQTSSFH
jgi:hypothetical protein